MALYVALHPQPQTKHGILWDISATEARRIDGSTQVERVLSGPPNLEIENHAGWRFIPQKLAPGEYYPRIARPSLHEVGNSPGIGLGADPTIVQSGRGQLAVLREQLERIFRTVHPAPANSSTYGHDLRNLLILAATEVEAQWKGVLRESRLAPTKPTTNDYVKLLPALKLDEYGVRLPFYPWLEAITPFKGWLSAAPTKTLPWYDAYNNVKHDRETNFDQATLLHAIQAVCGCAVMLFAQFGAEHFTYGDDTVRFFALESKPKWDLTELYCTYLSSSTNAVPYPF